MLGGMEDPFIGSVNFSQFSICRPVEQKKKKTRKTEPLSHLDHVVLLLWGMSKNVYLMWAVINGSFFTLLSFFQQLKLHFFALYSSRRHTQPMFWWWLIQYSYKSAAHNFTLMLLWPVSFLSNKSKRISRRVDAATQNSHHSLSHYDSHCQIIKMLIPVMLYLDLSLRPLKKPHTTMICCDFIIFGEEWKREKNINYLNPT